VGGTDPRVRIKPVFFNVKGEKETACRRAELRAERRAQESEKKKKLGNIDCKPEATLPAFEQPQNQVELRPKDLVGGGVRSENNQGRVSLNAK